MGVSNSLGANTLDILLCMGFPWFIKAMISWYAGGNSYIQMNSDSLFYTIIALIIAVIILYIVVAISGYRLSRKVGVILIIMYAIFLAVAIALEMFMYYEGKIFPCDDQTVYNLMNVQLKLYQCNQYCFTVIRTFKTWKNHCKINLISTLIVDLAKHFVLLDVLRELIISKAFPNKYATNITQW